MSLPDVRPWKPQHQLYALHRVCGLLLFFGPCLNLALASWMEHIEDLSEISLDLEYSYTGGRYVNHPFRYRLFPPRPYVEHRLYPLIVWLHGGGGEPGNDNIGQLNYVNTHVYDQGKDANYPFFLLATQCPRDNGWYQEQKSKPTFGQQKGDELVTVTMEVLEQTLQTYPIDSRRVSIVGISGGGSGVWEFLSRYPDKFAAGAPIAGGGGNLAQASKLAQIPIWAFHVRADKDVSIEDVRGMVAAIQAAGGKCYLTETPGYIHDCWTPAFMDFGLLDWLRSQQKGINGPVPNYNRIDNQVRLALQAFRGNGPQYYLFVPVLVAIGFWMLRNRIQRIRHRADTANNLAVASSDGQVAEAEA